MGRAAAVKEGSFYVAEAWFLIEKNMLIWVYLIAPSSVQLLPAIWENRVKRHTTRRRIKIESQTRKSLAQIFGQRSESDYEL